MELGFSGDGFGNLLLLSGLIMMAVIFAVLNIAKKRGIDVKSTRFQFKVLTIIVIVFVVIPLLLSDLSFKDKIIVSVLVLAGGMGNFFALDRMEKYFKNKRRNKK